LQVQLGDGLGDGGAVFLVGFRGRRAAWNFAARYRREARSFLPELLPGILD
jgi:hypothetical protein